MGNTAREINAIVTEAARKKKAMDANKEVEDKSDFTDAAVDSRKKLQRNLKRDVKMHSRFSLYIVIGLGIFFVGYLVLQAVELYYAADGVEWKSAVVRVEDYEKAKEFVKNSFVEYKINLDLIFYEGIPLTWKNNAKSIIESMRGSEYEASSVMLDTKNKGNEALLKVTCSARGKNNILFFVILENGNFHILRIEKIQSKVK